MYVLVCVHVCVGVNFGPECCFFCCCCFCCFSAENFSPDAYEELLVNCLGTLNNLTYYSKGSNHIMEKLEEVTSCKFLCCLLPSTVKDSVG